METGAESEPWRTDADCLFLVPHGLLNLLCYSTKDQQPRDDTNHSELGQPTSITNQENVL